MSGAGRVMSEKSSIYVIGAKAGARKIGHGLNPLQRLRVLQTGSAETLFVLSKTEVSRYESLQIEQYAHWLLAGRRLRNEWFSVSTEDAEAAVANAIIAVRAGEVPLKRSGSQHTSALNLVMPPSEHVQLEDWAHEHRVRSLSAAVRSLIRFALANGAKPDAEPDLRRKSDK